jgi:multisubunit Na+/H+ antiporter MnhB subunit
MDEEEMRRGFLLGLLTGVFLGVLAITLFFLAVGFFAPQNKYFLLHGTELIEVKRGN